MLLRTLTVSALTTLVAAQSVPLQPRTVVDVLPASTYAAVRFGGLDACRQAVGQLPMTQLVESFFGELPAELRDQILEEGLAEAADELRQNLQEAGIKPAELRAVLSQPMAVAVGRLSIEGMGASICLLVEEGNRRQEINNTMRAVGRLMPRLGVDLKVGRDEIAGHKLYHLHIEDGPPVFAGWMGNHYVVSNSRGFLKEIANVQLGKQPSLATTTRVGQLRQQLPAPPLMSMVVNASTVMDAIAPHMPYEAADMSDALGLGRLDLIYSAMTASERGGTDLLHVGIGGSESGLAKALVAKPADLSFANVCSPNTIVFGAGSFDLPAVIDAFERFVKLLPAAAQQEIHREMGREMAREMRHMGTSPTEVHSIMKAFGDQVGMAISLEKGAVPKPELLVRLSVDERGPVSSLMQRIEALSTREAHVEWRSRKAGDHEVRFCNVQVEDQLQLSPCYVLDEGNLWIGSDVAGLVRALRRAGKPQKSLAATEDFAQMAREATGASGVVHIRSFRGVEIGWRSVETMLYPMLDANADEIGFDSEALPDSEELAAALGTTTFVYRVDDDGVTVKTEGPMAMGALLAAFGMLGDEVLSRATGKVF